MPLTSPDLSVRFRQLLRMASWNFAYFPAGGFCVVASAFACVDFFFDFVALCGRIGTDGAFAVAAIASSAELQRQRPTTAQRQHLRPPAAGEGQPATAPAPEQAPQSGHAASDHPGDRTEDQADAGKTGAGKTTAQVRRRRRPARRHQHPMRPALPTLPAERRRCRNWRAR